MNKKGIQSTDTTIPLWTSEDNGQELYQENDFIPQDLDEDWNPCAPSDSDFVYQLPPVKHTKNNKQQHFMTGAHRVGHILKKRKEAVTKTSDYVDRTTSSGVALGIGMMSMGSGSWLGMIIGGASMGLKYINKLITKYAHNKMDIACQALETCKSLEADHKAKDKAFNSLLITARHIRYWENSKSISTTLVKFFAAEVFTVVAAAFSVVEGRDGLNHKHKKQLTTSDKLHGALWEMHSGMKEHSTQATNTKQPKHS